jgi:hypothetical protein
MSFCRETERTARKEYKCNLCHKVIQVGERYIDHVDNICDESNIVVAKECLDCQMVKKEFLADPEAYNEDGYCDDGLYEWWRNKKCWECGNSHPVCSPDVSCQKPCLDLKNGRCTADYCSDMTHHCRCENFKQIEN